MKIEAPDRWLCCALDVTETELDYYDVMFADGHMRPGAAQATLLKDAGEVTALFPPQGQR